MKALFQKLAEVVNGPTVDWTKAQQSPVNGYVSPGEDLPYDDSPTKALPAPGEQVQPVRRRGLFRRRRNFVQENNPTSMSPPKLNTPTIPPEEDTQNEDKEYFMPMTPGLAGTLNADLRDKTPPNWKSWPTPTWNPWHNGYSRKPNTIAPDNKNPELHDEEAYQRFFGPRPTDWRQDNPAGWFNFSTARISGKEPDGDKLLQEYIATHTPADTGWIIAPPIGDPNWKPPTTWEEWRKEAPEYFDLLKKDLVESAYFKKEKKDPNIIGPFTDSDETWDGDTLYPYKSRIGFPDVLDIQEGYSRANTRDKDGFFDDIPPWELFPYKSHIARQVGVHEATHNITSFLSDRDKYYGKYPLNYKGLVPMLVESPTTAIENTYGNNGRFVPEVISNGGPMRQEKDEYFQILYPTADTSKVQMAGQVDPTQNDEEVSIDFDARFNPQEYYNNGIRYWNIPAKDGSTVEPERLRFFPDTPTGLYYDRYGNSRLAGGELARYDKIWGDTKAKDFSQLPPNFVRNLENMGQAPQAWIDAIDRPEEFTQAQDRVRRELFPLLRQDVLGELRKGNMEGVKYLRDYKHPAAELISKLMPDNFDDFYDLTENERLSVYNKIADAVEAQYPELIFNPEATPSYLVDAQKLFGITPEIGFSDIRTIDQYNDISRYIDYFRNLERYERLYGNQGGGRWGS